MSAMWRVRSWGREAKVRALEEITARLGIAEADVMAVGGDGANDLGMLGRAGAGGWRYMPSRAWRLSAISGSILAI